MFFSIFKINKIKLYTPKQKKAEKRNRNQEDWKNYEAEKSNPINNYIKYERTTNSI